MRRSASSRSSRQAILRRGRNPNANAQYMKDAEERRAESSKAFQEKFAWQSDETQDPLIEFKRRQGSARRRRRPRP